MPSVSQQSGFSLVIFWASECTSHLQWDTGLDCRLVSLKHAHFYHEAKLLKHFAEFGLALSSWNKQGRPWQRHHLDGSICCSKNRCVSFSINGSTLPQSVSGEVRSRETSSLSECRWHAASVVCSIGFRKGFGNNCILFLFVLLHLSASSELKSVLTMLFCISIV